MSELFRWHNHLNPAIKKEAWTQEEELTLIRAHEAHGNKWAELSKYLPGRYFEGVNFMLIRACFHLDFLSSSYSQHSFKVYS